MAIQKTASGRGNIPITDAIHVVKRVVIFPEKDIARIQVESYKDETERTAENSFDNNTYVVKDDNFATYFDDQQDTRSIKEKAQDYLLNEEEIFSEATIIE